MLTLRSGWQSKAEMDRQRKHVHAELKLASDADGSPTAILTPVRDPTNMDYNPARWP